MTKEWFKSFNIIYKREYVDPESEYDTFWSSATIYRNVPIEKIKYYRKQLLKFKAYANKTSASVEQLKAWMDAETWFTAEEAKDYGLCDHVIVKRGEII